MATDEQISKALENEYDGVDGFLMVQEILELKECMKVGGESLESANADVKRLQEYADDLERRLKSHSKGEAVGVWCRKCEKRLFHVDDEPIICPFCGEDGMPITQETK